MVREEQAELRLQRRAAISPTPAKLPVSDACTASLAPQQGHSLHTRLMKWKKKKKITRTLAPRGYASCLSCLPMFTSRKKNAWYTVSTSALVKWMKEWNARSFKSTYINYNKLQKDFKSKFGIQNLIAITIFKKH